MPTPMFSSNTFIAGGNFHQHNINSKDPFDRLLEAASPAAFHNSIDLHDPPKCHPNTRVAVLNKIMDWIHGADTEIRNALIMWIFGPAGSGKSAIARTIAELCAEEGILVASYFFSRFDSTRNHGKSLIATIAYRASLCFPDIRDCIIKAIEHDPLIFTRSLDAQLLSLVIKPLQGRIDGGYFRTATASRVIIIDGLDECDHRDSQVAILVAISKALQHWRLPLVFLLASRPEPDIRTAFGFGFLNDVSIRTPLDDEYLTSEDIRLFLQDKFTEIKHAHPFRTQILSNWPSEVALQAVVDKASGQFIYASTVIKFVKSNRHHPAQRLEVILKIRPAYCEMPFAELDALYMPIFSCVANSDVVMRILALQLLSLEPFPLHVMETVLSLEAGDILMLLCDLASLISIKKDSWIEEWERLHLFHASLEDFLFDQSRSKQFWINAQLLHTEFAVQYMKVWTQPELYTKWVDSNMPTSWALSNNSNHFRAAVPTLGLRECLVNFSFASLLAEQDCCHHIPNFFASIRTWKFDDATSIHDHQLQLFDSFAKRLLEKMYRVPALAALVTIVHANVPNTREFRSSVALFRLKKNDLRLDGLSFHLRILEFSRYRRFILEFLESPSRAGIYMLTGQRYATAAVYLLKYIRNHSEQLVLSSYTLLRKDHRHKNAPWLWRKGVKRAPSSEAAQIFRWQIISTQEDKPWIIKFGLHEIAYSFRLALKCLAQVLPRSDCSHQLTKLARQLTFGPLSRKDARRKKAVRREIARYLARVEQSGALST